MYSMEDTFRESIEKFIKVKLEDVQDFEINDNTPSRIFFKGKKLKLKDLKKVFENIEEQNLDKEIIKLEPNEIREDIIQSILNKNNKDTAHKVYSTYIDYMNQNYFKDEIKARQIQPLPTYYSELERRLLIAKKMHEEFNIEDIAREFLVSPRTIKKDLSDLQNGKIKVLDQKLQVEYERNGEHIQLKSKVHPLFLVENLTQVIALLNGLSYARRDYGYHEYAKETAVSIWMQLSDDAKDRIQNVLVDRLNLNKSWYDEISQESEKEYMFKVEEDFSSDRYLDIRKNGKNCIIQYRDDDGKIVDQYVDEIISKEGKIITAIIYEENREIKINTDKIICYLPQLKSRRVKRNK